MELPKPRNDPLMQALSRDQSFLLLHSRDMVLDIYPKCRSLCLTSSQCLNIKLHCSNGEARKPSYPTLQVSSQSLEEIGSYSNNPYLLDTCLTLHHIFVWSWPIHLISLWSNRAMCIDTIFHCHCPPNSAITPPPSGWLPTDKNTTTGQPPTAPLSLNTVTSDRILDIYIYTHVYDPSAPQFAARREIPKPDTYGIKPMPDRSPRHKKKEVELNKKTCLSEGLTF